MKLRFAPPLVLLALLLAPLFTAEANARLAYLTRQLKTAKDARVRAQSAVVIGKMEETSAVEPLCEGLSDESELVRTAAANALEQIGEVSALTCLEAHAGSSDSETRQAVTRAVASLKAMRDRKPVMYISLKPLKLKGVELEAALLAQTQKRIEKQLNRKGALLAPSDESKSEAKQVLKSKKLKGYTLMPELETHGDAGLRLRVLCLTYPDQSILGEVDVKASGGKPADLLGALAPRVIDEAAQIIGSKED